MDTAAGVDSFRSITAGILVTDVWDSVLLEITDVRDSVLLLIIDVWDSVCSRGLSLGTQKPELEQSLK